MSEIKQEIKHIKRMGEVLIMLAEELEQKRFFDKIDLELIVNIGTTFLWKGKTLDFTKLFEET